MSNFAFRALMVKHLERRAVVDPVERAAGLVGPICWMATQTAAFARIRPLGDPTVGHLPIPSVQAISLKTGKLLINLLLGRS